MQKTLCKGYGHAVVGHGDVFCVCLFQAGVHFPARQSTAPTVHNSLGAALVVSPVSACQHGTVHWASGKFGKKFRDLDPAYVVLLGMVGTGFLYVRKGIRLPNLIEGGGQEQRRRAGTENLAGIMGMSEALRIAVRDMDEHMERVSAMRDRLISEIEKIPRVRLNGDRERRLPGNINFCFDGIEGESLLLSLDLEGICASSGSACTSGSLEPSHVLLAIGIPKEVAHGSLRLSIDAVNTDEEIDYITEKLPPIVERLRDMSPVWEEIIKEERKISA